MRGQLLDYDAGSGAGLISGDDGRRYRFAADTVGRAQGLRAGVTVDFEPQGDTATSVYPLTSDSVLTPRPTEVDPGMWGYFVKCMKMYFNGSGRATRKEFWSFVLFAYLIIFGVMIAGVVAVVVLASSAQAQSMDASAPSDAIGAVVLLIGWVLRAPFFAPYYAVSARRLHDIGASGWLALLILIPYAGSIFMLVVGLIPGQPHRNRYDLGADPRVFS